MSSKLYNRAFKIGVGVTIFLFAVLNVISFIVAWRADQKSQIKFSNAHLDWGVPFSWTWYTGIGLGFMLSFAVIAACSFAMGFLFRYFAREG